MAAPPLLPPLVPSLLLGAGGGGEGRGRAGWLEATRSLGVRAVWSRLDSDSVIAACAQLWQPEGQAQGSVFILGGGHWWLLSHTYPKELFKSQEVSEVAIRVVQGRDGVA